MREPSGALDTVSCAQAARLFEKRISESPLSETELRAFEAHLDQCEGCRKLSSWMDALPTFADTLSDAEVEAARKAVRERSPADSAAIEGHRWGRWGAAIGAVAAVATLLIGIGLMESGAPEPSATTPVAAAACTPSAVSEPVPGISMAVCGNADPNVIVEASGVLRVKLTRGTVGLFVDPDRPNPHRVAVETPLGSVQVKGTLFTVRMEPENARVEVFRGVVEFVPESGEPVRVGAGRGTDLARRRTFARNGFQTDPLREALEPEAVSPAVSAPATGAEAPLDPEDERPVTSAAEEALETDAALSPNAAAQRRRGAARSAKEGGNSVPSVDALIQGAQSCLIDRNWYCASARYQDVLTLYPGRPESRAVLVSLGRLELRRLGAPRKALRRYQAYREQMPNGPLAGEALFGMAEAYRQLGEREAEAQTLRQFIRRYPGSPQVASARARLGRLAKSAANP